MKVGKNISAHKKTGPHATASGGSGYQDGVLGCGLNSGEFSYA